VRLQADVREIYVYANTLGDDVEWRGTKSLCVSMNGSFDYADAENRPCAAKRLFKRYSQDASGELSAALRGAEAMRVAYRLTLCNETDDFVAVALGSEPQGGSGLSADGWYDVESGQCRTYIRRGKADYAYFFAQSSGRRLVWYGKVGLCTRYHEGFRFAGADSSACRDGDSERLPFTKIPLAKGVGSYDLTAEDAHSFKSSVKLCNGFRKPIYPAIAHLDEIWMSGVVARGFWLLRPGECKLVDSVSTSQVYLYAETMAGDRVWGGKELKGCVRDEGFTFPSVDRYACGDEDERHAGFLLWNVSEGANVYKFQ
jgi:uncharacterized membrane protein